MSNSLVKVFDNSILPAAIMILGKVLGVFAVIWMEDLPWSFKDYTNGLLDSGTGLMPEDLEIVTSFSDLVMYIFVATYFSISLFRAIFLHNTHIKPTFVAKLANKNLINLIQNSYEIYHSAATNLIFLWVGSLLILTNTITGVTYIWIGIMCLGVTIILTSLLLQDVYREIESIKKNPSKYNWA